MMNAYYMEKLCSMMRDRSLDAMLICPSMELKFLAGIAPMFCERFQGLVVKADRSCFYVCNLLYRDEICTGLPKDVPVYTWFDGEDMKEIVSGILRQQGLEDARIGVNSTAPAWQLIELSGVMRLHFVNAKPLLEEMRVIKTADEMDALRQSAKIADEAFEAVLPKIHAGLKEKDVMDMLCEEMTKRGGENAGGLTATGPNASYPHYQGNQRVIEDHDVVLMDYGCTWKGMYSDISRTVFVGEPTKEQRRVYEIVDEAQKKAQETAVCGAFIPDIDAAARNIIKEKGYGETFVNRVGHGIGYMYHEAPDIKQSNHRFLEKGMAFSIEPGIYLADRFGIRIENIVLINEKGETEILNQAPREIIIL